MTNALPILTLFEDSSRSALAASIPLCATGTQSAKAVSPSSIQRFVEPAAPEDQVFDRLVQLKVSTSKIAMHLDNAWRAGLFRQLDGLLDAEDWDFSDQLPSVASFRTFLRMIIAFGSARRPSLGATSTGEIVAAWSKDGDRLTIECLANDQIRWVMSRTIDGRKVSAAGKTFADSVLRELAPYDPRSLLDG